MVAAIAIYPASGSIIVKETACRVTVTGVPATLTSSYNASNQPSQTAKTYRITATHSGADSLVSHEFTPTAGAGSAPTGTHEWDDVIFPYHGAWTLNLVDQSDDSVDATLAVTVTT